MRIALVSRPLAADDLRLAQQLGVTDIVSTLPGTSMAPEAQQGPAWSYDALLAMRRQVENAGLTLSVIEGYQLSDRITLGLPGRDDDLARVGETIRTMGRAGIPIYCYNFMAVFNWLRTSLTTHGRGGALVTRYDHSLMARAPETYAGQTSDAAMWDNFAYFLERILPVAEEAGVKMALHPDDPPLSPVRGLARIMRSVDAFQRVLAMSDSPANGITFCQGNFAAMGADVPATIRALGAQGRIFFAHLRDVRGTADAFEETFHDEGQTDMVEVMRAYRDIGFAGPIRPDHAPTMAGESNDNPGYMVRGKIFAVGYMKGLIEAAGFPV